METNTKSFYFRAGIIIILIGIIGYILLNQSDQTRETVKIGVVLPFSGLAANIGEESREGIELALKDLNDSYPNLDLELMYEDSAYDPKTGVSAYQKLTSINGAKLVITGGTKISGPIRETAKDDEVIQMAIWSGAPSYSDTHDRNFRTTALSGDNVPVLLDYLASNNLTTLALFYPKDEFGETYRASFEEMASDKGITIVGSEGYLATEKDFRGSLNTLKATEPEVIFIAGTAGQLGNAFKQARELGITAPFLSQGAAESKQMLDLAGVASEGLVYSYYFDTEGNVEAREFAAAYEEVYKKVPSQYAAEAYVGTILLADAVHACKYQADVECVTKYLDEVQNQPSILGTITINDRGDLKPDPIFLKTVEDGKFVKLK